jgi:hypothetical protein
MRQIRFSSRVRAILFGTFLLVIAQQAWGHLAQASLVNEQYNNLIPFEGDTHEYQRLAVNLLYGKGFTDSIVLPFEAYHLDADYSILGRDTLERYETEGVDNAPRFSFYRAPAYPFYWPPHTEFSAMSRSWRVVFWRYLQSWQR